MPFKYAFYFILKALSVLKIFKFSSSFFWPRRKNDLIRKVRLILKFRTWLRNNYKYTYCTMFLEIKGNQMMKFGQAI